VCLGIGWRTWVIAECKVWSDLVAWAHLVLYAVLGESCRCCVVDTVSCATDIMRLSFSKEAV
jgi:hypothetical protein